MKYIKATEEYAEQVFILVQNTIKTIYPKYYPEEVVDFFCQLHNKEKITEDIKNGCVSILFENDCLVGTGSYADNHITRVYVHPDFQGRGYGSFIMQTLEDEISVKHNKVYLDASLPASHLYEKRGYKTIKHDKWIVENGVILVYEIMEKKLNSAQTAVFYNNKTFVPKVNTENGEVNGETTFNYHQSGNVLWADYSGGEILKGNLFGTVDKDGKLSFYYQHINKDEQLRAGKCTSTPHISEDGKIELHEQWQWINGDKTKGTSIIVEK